MYCMRELLTEGQRSDVTRFVRSSVWKTWLIDITEFNTGTLSTLQGQILVQFLCNLAYASFVIQ